MSEQLQQPEPYVKITPKPDGPLNLEVVGMDQAGVVKLLLKTIDRILFAAPKTHEQRPAIVLPNGPVPNLRGQ